MALVTESMLTTSDNPYDPFTQFDEWYMWDTSHGYDSAGLLGRIVVVSDETSSADQRFAVETAIDEIVSENVTGMFKKVSRQVTVSDA